jgi:eukaryotic-like serine/threonine-protein kinase
MGRFRIVRQIGEGSAAAVYVGEYGALKRPVAIKLLHEHLVGDSAARRMLAEARTLSLLDHPGIVKVFDVGELHGRSFIVMERLAGESLRTRLARGRLAEGRAVSFARQLASALAAAHAVGIVHRDLKPENVVVVRDPDVPGGERVKIIDFGIAKRGGFELGERTATGVVLGTPCYMAPEQWERTVDARADIYSLGVLIYVMATGELPFSGTTDEVLAEQAYCAPPRAAAVAGVSSWLSSIIDRCLEKRPGARFPTMAALGAALRELEAAIAPPTGPTPRYDDDESDEERTTPGPRAGSTDSDDESATVAVRAIGTSPPHDPARSRFWTALDRMPRWAIVLWLVLVALIVANSDTTGLELIRRSP